MIRVLVADDHAGFRFGMRTLLGTIPEVTVVAEAAHGDEAVTRALTHQPDVVLMDLDMAPTGGLEATRHLARDAPHVGVLVLTMTADDGTLVGALQAGARGYLVKGASRAEVERALHTVADGGVVVGAALARRVSAVVDTRRDDVSLPLGVLSPREREVVDLMARGLTNSEIATRLVLSPKTVRNLVSSVFTKLQASDRVEVVLRAREAGLGGDPGGGRDA